MNLKEMLIKAEMNEKQLIQTREELEIVRCQLQESEMQNQNSLVSMILIICTCV